MPQPYIDAGWVRDQVLAVPIQQGHEDDKPWHRWQDLARRHGVAEDLVLYGAMLMATSWAEDWPAMAKVECGWLDGGAGLLYQALNEPAKARHYWPAALERHGRFRHAA